MNFLPRFLLKIAVNGAALYLAASYLEGFQLASSPYQFVLGAVLLALVHLVLRPILSFISFPFILLTFGLFNIVINVVLLMAADYLTASITITDLQSLLIASFIIGLANAII